MNIKDFLSNCKFLPWFLRDFHDQKALFKSVERHMGRDDEARYGVDWVKANCYTIDKFLRYMAMHGYTLQKSRVHCDFCSLEETLKKDEEERVDMLKKYFEKSKIDKQ